jgi:hypothetical protein
MGIHHREEQVKAVLHALVDMKYHGKCKEGTKDNRGSFIWSIEPQAAVNLNDISTSAEDEWKNKDRPYLPFSILNNYTTPGPCS